MVSVVAYKRIPETNKKTVPEPGPSSSLYWRKAIRKPVPVQSVMAMAVRQPVG